MYLCLMRLLVPADNDIFNIGCRVPGQIDVDTTPGLIFDKMDDIRLCAHPSLVFVLQS